MPSFKVPKKYSSGLAKFFLLSEETFQQFVTNLHSAPFSLDYSKLLRDAFRAVEGIPSSDRSAMAEALASLYNARALSDLTTVEFVHDIAQAVVENSSTELGQFDSKDWLTTRLTTLLEAGSVELAAKSKKATADYVNLFYGSRVSTDIRPVFKGDEISVAAVLIMHTLKIHYHSGEEHKDFFIALDDKDVQELINSLERAKAKGKSLETLIEAANIPYIDVE
jgi:hypothetical protein